MINKQINIYSKLFVFFMIFPNIKPASFINQSEVANVIFDIMKVISFLFIIYAYIYSKKIPDKITMSFIIMVLWIEIGICINGNTVVLWDFIVIALTAINIFLIYDFYNDQIYNVIKSTFLIMLFYVTLSLILFIILGAIGKGERHPIISNKNLFVLYVLPLLICFLIIKKLKKINLLITIIVILDCTGVAIVDSVTSEIAMIGFLIVFILCVNFNWRVKAITIAIVVFVLDLFVSVFQTYLRMDFFDRFFEVTKRSDTLTSRISIWNQFFALFKRRPVLGYGFGKTIRVNNTFVAAHPHNMWFYYAFISGVIGLGLFLLFNFLFIKKIGNYKNIYVRAISLATLVALNIFFIAESTFVSDLFLIYALEYNLGAIDNYMNKNRIYGRRVKIKLFNKS